MWFQHNSHPPIYFLFCSTGKCPTELEYFKYLFQWLISSLTYQIALVFSSVSTVNLISASSSLFVLVLSALFSSHVADRFSWTKLFLVVLNLSGVAIISQFFAKFIGVVLSLISAFTYAVYLVIFSTISRRTGQIDINLMFGVIGLFSFVVFTPVILVVHQNGYEPQLPLPTRQEMLILILNSLIGSIFSDYLWLYATLLTSSLVSSISLTLTIPLSLICDLLIRNQPPTLNQLIAAIPIMIVSRETLQPYPNISVICRSFILECEQPKNQCRENRSVTQKTIAWCHLLRGEIWRGREPYEHRRRIRSVTSVGCWLMQSTS